MKADLFVQGHFWASIDLPGDSLLALLAKGLLDEAQRKADQLREDLDSLDGVTCSISLRVKEPYAYSDPQSDQPLSEFAP